MTVPQTILAPLERADGSATFSQGGYTVIGAVNGPVEVQRRDELPEEAAIEVNVRPAIGVGSTWNRELPQLFRNTHTGAKVQKNDISNQSSTLPCAMLYSQSTIQEP